MATSSIYRIIGSITFIIVVAIFYVAARKRRLAEERLHAESVNADVAFAPLKREYPWSRGTLISLGLAAFYLLIFRIFTLVPPFVWDHNGGAILMSASFLFLGPFVAGLLTIYQVRQHDPWSVKAWIIAPWLPVILNILLALSFAWEGVICVVFILPPALLSASLGGVAAGLMHRYFRRSVSSRTLYSLAALPLILAVVETRLNQPLQTRTVDTSIVIHAPQEVVWQNIERVHAIKTSELRRSWANSIGFPRPVEATLSREGVGGIRNASFERGLNFTETITDWVPNQRIVFTIQADTSMIPATTLDEHVTVGGRFFDVLSGEYVFVHFRTAIRFCTSAAGNVFQPTSTPMLLCGLTRSCATCSPIFSTLSNIVASIHNSREHA